MNLDISLINYFLQAGIVVKCVMALLIAASVFSWAYILQRSFYLKTIQHNTQQFEKAFWSGEDITKLYTSAAHRPAQLAGINAIFYAGYQEYARFRQHTGTQLNLMIDNCRRAMRAAQINVQNDLEARLPFLAIVGSTSPYVGLFGTVWGMMQALRALANVQQATIAMVAPGIAEALIATALGLFAAIPAVIAYNRFITDINRLMNRYDAFQEEFTNILIRQADKTAAKTTVEA